MPLDSNIIIYAAQPAHTVLRAFVAQHAPATSVISQIEVLGFHKLEEQDKTWLDTFFAVTEVLPLSALAVQQAIELRQKRRMSLGDSIVAATALVHGRTLVTHNTSDFHWISELELLDPLAS
jgi:predicted nucleic acid-binding protein